MALMAAGADVHCKGKDGCGRGVALRGPFASAPFKLCFGSANCLPDTGVCLLCSYTPLHQASFSGHTETAMALMAAGANVHGEDESGYGRDVALRGSWRGPSADCAGGPRFGSAHCLPDTGVCLLCSFTALHWASSSGHTETAMALMALMREQAIAELARIFTAAPPSAIAAALDEAGGNVEHAANLLAKATQESPAEHP